MSSLEEQFLREYQRRLECKLREQVERHARSVYVGNGIVGKTADMIIIDDPGKRVFSNKLLLLLET